VAHNYGKFRHKYHNVIEQREKGAFVISILFFFALQLFTSNTRVGSILNTAILPQLQNVEDIFSIPRFF